MKKYLRMSSAAVMIWALRVKVFLCNGQGPVGLAILYMDRSCCVKSLVLCIKVDARMVSSFSHAESQIIFSLQQGDLAKVPVRERLFCV